MKKYKCTSCLRKHLSACKSFMRQVLDGHGEGAFPDHRIDIQGELVNSEYHAEVIDECFMKKIRYLRRQLQGKKFIPDEQNLKTIDILYYYSYKFDGDEVLKQISDEYNLLYQTDSISNINSQQKKKGCGCNKNKKDELKNE